MNQRAWTHRIPVLVAAVTFLVSCQETSRGDPRGPAVPPAREAGPGNAAAVPVRDGLVLWLDASDAATLSQDAQGHLRAWSDKSSCGNHARQPAVAHQPRWVASALGNRPVVRFDGDDFLVLGQAHVLDFKPGSPFTVAVVYQVEQGAAGTFLAKGGGTAAERAYQFYVAPGRLGAIAYGVMRESPAPAGAHLSIAVCDGSSTNVSLDGQPSLSLTAGRGASRVDVLIGARRKDADNTGTYYGLNGDLAEILVYRRTLDNKEQMALCDYVAKKYRLAGLESPGEVAHRLKEALESPEVWNQLDALVAKLERLGTQGPAVLEIVLRENPAAALPAAELLVRVAEKNALHEGLAERAAELLDHEDPFVRGLAEWAIAMKVGGENNGQQAAWPKPDPPRWYQRWSSLAPDALLEADWVRQAAGTGVHRDAARLLASVDRMIERAAATAARYPADRLSPEALDRIGQRLERLKALRGRLAASIEAQPHDRVGHHRLWMEARRQVRQVALANPALDFDELLLVTRFTPHTVRNITRSYPWKHKPGGSILVLSGLRAEGKVRDLLGGKLGPGHVRGLDLWWDAGRVVFAYARQTAWPPPVNTADSNLEGLHAHRLRKAQEPIHLFEIRTDGTGLKQLTEHPFWSDFEPTYCANGDVVFVSERCGRSPECGSFDHDHVAVNLYRLSSDGSEIAYLTANKDYDRYPHSLDNGLIAFTRWEYQERHFMEVHSIWTVRPDGTMSDALFKHHLSAPLALRDTRSVPESSKLVSVAAGHHTFAYGPVVLVDPRGGLNNEAGIEIVTPGVRPQEGPMAGRVAAEGGVEDRGGLYQTPWALSEDAFLAAYAYARPNCTASAGADSNGFALYYLDVFGNKELIYRDPLLSCALPIPLKKRPRPPLVPDVREESQEATCYVVDVYQGIPGVPRGTIKYLRIAQHVGWPYDPDHGAMPYLPDQAYRGQFGFNSWSPVRVLGTVRVEADGSACFKVPPHVALYFQALDEHQMEIRRMRTMVSFQPGETRGCRGCHESEAKAPPFALALGRPEGKQDRQTASIPLALTKPPQTPVPPPWGASQLLEYESLVQPVLDRHCTNCHGNEEPAGGLDFSASRAADGFLQSYRTIFGLAPGATKPGRVLVSVADRFSNAAVSQPKQFGSHRSPLIRVLLDDDLHRKEVRLDDQEWLSLVTWVDANAPYYGRFFNKRPADRAEPVRNAVPLVSNGIE